VSESLDEIRDRITANDCVIIAAMNERLRLVAALWQLKREIGADRLDPGREQALRGDLAALNTGPLSAEGLDRLVTELLALTKAELAESVER
jgi:chorismate mutase